MPNDSLLPICGPAALVLLLPQARDPQAQMVPGPCLPQVAPSSQKASREKLLVDGADRRVRLLHRVPKV
jgi:hypothetical protein